MEGGESLHTAFLAADNLASEPLEKYRVLFCVNLPALNAEAADRLAAYVAGGGNIVWICGDNVIPEAYNLMNQRAGDGCFLCRWWTSRAAWQRDSPIFAANRPLAPNEKRDSWHVSFLDKTHPALSGLVEPASLYESVLVFKHVRMKESEKGAWILARLDDGEPLLAQRNVEKGKVLMLGTSAAGELVEPAATESLSTACESPHVRSSEGRPSPSRCPGRPAARTSFERGAKALGR